MAVSSAIDGRVREPSAIAEPESQLAELSSLTIEELYRAADAESVGLTKHELAGALLAIGIKCNYGLAPGVHANRVQVGAFWRALQLRDLALAQACALGRGVAWQRFLSRYREPLTQAAIGITRSATSGSELADSLYSEMFGLTERDGQRRSPLTSYSGRGSLMGFLRATLAQRNAGQHRRTSREVPLAVEDLPAASPAPTPSANVLSRLGDSLAATLLSLTAEERFLLSAWFLDRRTLAEIAQVLRVHESTMSRRIKRLTSSLRKGLLANLQKSGLSRPAAEEALGTDPRDLNINLRSLLQASSPAAFLQQGGSAELEQA
ncbi:MAG: sigma-70 family RNA polymerase sigma factor [Bryobacteraceae bacterium]